MIEWLPGAIACSLLFVWLAYKEYNRANTGYRPARIIASLVACSCLALAGIPLKFTRTVTNSDSTAVVLTPGFVRDSVNRFIKANNVEPSVYTTDYSLATDQQLKDTYVSSLNDLGGKNLHVFGHGFNT